MRKARIASHLSMRRFSNSSIGVAAASSADVGAGREHALASAEDDAADRLVAVELLQRRHDRVHQLTGERVQRLGAVHQHDTDRAFALDDDQAHLPRSRNARTAPCASSPSIDIASQSRACVVVWCHASSRQTFSCAFA